MTRLARSNNAHNAACLREWDRMKRSRPMMKEARISSAVEMRVPSETRLVAVKTWSWNTRPAEASVTGVGDTDGKTGTFRNGLAAASCPENFCSSGHTPTVTPRRSSPQGTCFDGRARLDLALGRPKLPCAQGLPAFF